MKIRLKNFRCHSDAMFDFGDAHLTLLHGQSGKGKTSILMAIHFALFDTGTKIKTFGAKTCEVELEFSGMTITRTRTPNHLVLIMNGVSYEDEAAQAIIDQEFGTAFDITSYVSQGGMNSFMNMKPTEKLEFLEEFAFSDTDLAELKNRSKGNIKKTETVLATLNGKMSAVSQALEEMKEPVAIPFPLLSSTGQPIKNPKNQQTAIKNETVKATKVKNHIQKTRSEIASLEKEVAAVAILEGVIESKREMLDSLTEEILSLEMELTSISYDDEERVGLQERLDILVNNRELNSLRVAYDAERKKLKDMQAAEAKERADAIESITDSLWAEHSRDDLEKRIKQSRKATAGMKRLKVLDSLLEKNKVSAKAHARNQTALTELKHLVIIKRQLIDTLNLQKEVYTCPGCAMCLRFTDSGLVQVKKKIIESTGGVDEVKSEVAELEQEIQTMERTIQSDESKMSKCAEYQQEIDDGNLRQFEDCEIDDGEELERILQENLTLESRLESLQSQTVSRSVKTVEDSVKKLKAKLDALDQSCEATRSGHEDEEDLRARIETLMETKRAISSTKKRLATLIKDKETHENQIEKMRASHMEKFGDVRQIDVATLKESLTELETQYETHTHNLKLVDDYIHYETDKQRYDSQKEKKTLLTSEIDVAQKKHTAALRLRTKILEAESIALENIIDSINNHAKVYLNSFFPDYPITVSLLAFKEGTKKVAKPCINVQIEYKGSESDLSVLSGGEMSRVMLAYTLALGEIFNTKILMLDESTASLDQELTTDVFNSIRENFGGRLVLVVAHQIVNGMFDNVIEL